MLFYERSAAFRPLDSCRVGSTSGDKAEGVPALVVDTQVARRVRELDRLEVGEHFGSEVRTVTAAAVHRVPDPDNTLGDVAAGQGLFCHGRQVTDMPVPRVRSVSLGRAVG